MSAAFFRGTQIDQNVKFKDKDRQMIRDTEWPASFDQPVDLRKVSRIIFYRNQELFARISLALRAPTFPHSS